MEEFPGNSRRAVPPAENNKPPVDDKNLDAVITGNVVRRKPSIGRRFVKTFFPGDSGIFKYVVTEVLVPALQDLFLDTVRQATEKAVYGEIRSPRGSSSYRPRGVPRTQVSYDRVSSPRHSAIHNTPPHRQSSNQASAVDIGEIILDSMIDAQTVADKLYEILQEYNAVSVADLNTLLNQSSHYTDHKYGWTDLSDMTIRRIREGYLLLLPDPINLR